MEPTVKAILARFDNDRTQAYEYCKSLAEKYPHLGLEYQNLAQLLAPERTS